jgi:predicted HAD superfamily hydrolase
MEKSYKLLESIYGFDTSMEREMLEEIKKEVCLFMKYMKNQCF